MSPAPDLVLQGRVIEIAPVAGPGGSGRWGITVAVERVLEGQFAGDRFAFVVHSPVKSGLALGGVYTVRARSIDGGYQIDPLQWLPKPP